MDTALVTAAEQPTHVRRFLVHLAAYGAAAPPPIWRCRPRGTAFYAKTMDAASATTMIASFANAVLAALGPNLGWIVPMTVLGVVARFPMLRRGPNSSDRDPWRGFKNGARRTVLSRAGDRCEGAAFLVWGRCPSAAVEVDHVFPWARGGPTVVSNGQALCSEHNRSKGAMNPPWWYVLSLERRRRDYFPQGTDVRVFAVMGMEDIAARAVSSTRSRARVGNQTSRSR